MRRTFLIITGFIAVILISFAFKKPDQARYDNLKVLPKSTTKQQMDSVMKHFSASLGVKCTFCHVRGNDEQRNFDFASDDNKNKGIARDMMKMTAKINNKYFKNHSDENMIPSSAMTCYSCHHGEEHPATKPPAPAPKQ
jgi:cytochrome c553